MAQTVLVVDDGEDLRVLLKSYLTQEGYRVVTANNGREALFATRQEKPDIIILDLMMPEMGGYDFMRHYSREGNAPIILLTAKIEESDKVLGLELGAARAEILGEGSAPALIRGVRDAVQLLLAIPSATRVRVMVVVVMHVGSPSPSVPQSSSVSAV